MRRVLLLLIMLTLTAQLSAFEICGDIKSWQKEDFCGFDKVGDCTGECGDITSLFSRIENEKLYVRISFDDMVKRDGVSFVKDNFSNHNIKIVFSVLSKKDSNNVFASRIIDLHNKKFNIDRWRILRTPENNLLELAIPWKNHSISKEELLFTIKILLDGKIVDTFTEDGSRGSTGNCAFVHHGNQGLTYTEVFYGQDPPETSGYDEVLEVHQATDVPGNFHMSGTLMPAAEWHNPEFNDWLSIGVTEGWVAMLTSAFGQHIMPFLNDNMNNWSVAVECDMVEYLYNYIPKVAWIPERVWLSQGYYPDAGLSDPWLGDNWTQHGVEAVILDDWPHCSGYSNSKIHWMNNGSGITLRVIPINNEFVGKFWNDPDGAKNMIANTGQYGIIVYGTDWECAAEMNEHHNTFILDNYESVIWYCHDNYPAIEAWKLDVALNNSDFDGSSLNITNGTYGMLGGTDGYGGGNNSWYIDWAGCESHSDFHTPKWNYGFIWDDAYNNLMTAPNNSLSQLGWYTMMINLHETGWHTGGEIADWEHRYSSHIKNANVFAEASRWANGDYTTTTSAYFSDIDRDGVDELIMHNDKVFFVFESIGGKANWVFYKDELENAYSVVGSDMAYWSETDGDYNESSNNHFAALSDVSPNQQHAVYDINIDSSSGDSVQATLTQWGVSKTFVLLTGNNYLDVVYNFYDQTGYVKSGWTPNLLDLIWSGKSHLQRMWGDYGSYCGQRNSSSGATVALVLSNGGASHNLDFEGTLVKGDEIKGYKQFKTRLFAGWTSAPYDPYQNKVVELDSLSVENLDIFPPILNNQAFLVSDNTVQLTFNEAVDETTAEDILNYSLENFTESYTLDSAVRQADWRKVNLTINETFQVGDSGQIVVSNIEDLNDNVIEAGSSATLSVPSGMTPHTIGIDGTNDFDENTELIDTQTHTLDITWDDYNLYLGFYSFNLGSEGDLFVNIDTDQLSGSGATSGSWGRVNFANPYLPEYQVAIEGGGGSMQVNNWTAKGWNYPGNGAIGSSYEGWAENGLTEISIPWSELGNPTRIALSVHISVEDDLDITEAFPSLNSIGYNPTLEYVYAFFTPYINDDMPLSGMEPNKVFTLPNTSPQITSYQPDSLEITMEENDSQGFSITVEDFENDDLYYNWKLDGGRVSSDSSYTYYTYYDSQGLHTLEVTVTDNVPGNVPDTLVWSITVNDFILGVPVVTISIDGNDVILNWDPIENATSYIIYESEYPYSGFTQLDTAPTNSYCHVNGATGTKKFYRVTASSE